MVLAELQQVASQLGIKGSGRMRKAQLIDAIKATQSDGPAPKAAASAKDAASSADDGASSAGGSGADTTSKADESSKAARRTPRRASRAQAAPKQDDGAVAAAASETGTVSEATRETKKADGRGRGGSDDRSGDDRSSGDRSGNGRSTGSRGGGGRGEGAEAAQPEQSASDSTGERERSGDRDGARGDDRRPDSRRQDSRRPDNRRPDRQNDRPSNRGDDRQSNRGDDRQSNRGDDRQSNRGDDRQSNRGDDRDNDNDRRQGGRFDEDDDQSGRGRRRRRDRSRGNRDRRPSSGGGGGGRERAEEPQIQEDDVLIPVAGIIDILDNYAFVRTSGYLPGPNDVYVSLAMVRRHGMRKGDAVTGVVRQPREGEKQQKFNALVRVDTVNGADPDTAKQRPDFNKLTPLYPQDRLRMETESGNMSTRIIDLVAPIGKGQRGLIVSPPKAGKTLFMQAVANAVTANNPEAHLMVVLVDERPEEVTDFQRSVKGEVIASTFDRPADDHTTVAELAIERAKRLVELGHDVVILLDGITRLARAYNNAAPPSGRILSGGVDSAALYPPKKFFGAARNIENGGSLTILATALIETGSKMDEVIFEEFKGTGNMEIRLRRDLADKRLYPAIDVDASSTRREEILVGKEELGVMWQLRRVLSALDPQQAIELMLDRLKKTKSNAEFLMTVQKTTPTIGGNGSKDDD
ncbi:transcription termination factor Rho [Phytoactinopolyspora endophytica]|uniref:transcription termination factor Rho n=1 Tax=Phytoactinopolyspora endophytica TaxID=1642495 RepID=UPI003B831CCC